MHHAIGEVRFFVKDRRPLTVVTSTSKSSGKLIESYLAAGDRSIGQAWDAYLPNGSADRVTYYLGLLILAEAMAAPGDAVDLLDAYEDLISATKGGEIKEAHKELLCRAGDELYYQLRYPGLPVDAANDRLTGMIIHDLASFGLPGSSAGVTPFSANVFFEASALHDYRAGLTPTSASLPLPAASPKPRGIATICVESFYARNEFPQKSSVRP